MQLKHSIAIALVACGAALQSCQQERMTGPDANELYTRDFIKQFGIADPNHDWNMATRGGVSVTTSKPTDVKVYAKVGGKRYIFADYKNVNGTEAIEFDLPKGVDQLIVRANGRDYTVNNRASIRIDGGSRAIWEKENEVVKITRDDYRILTNEGVMAFKNKLPEDEDNLGEVTQNFSFVANGDFVIYPTYWQTAGFNTLGIYYIDEDANEMVHIPFYTNKIAPIDGTKGNLLYTQAEVPDEQKNISLKNADNPMDAAQAIGATELDPSEYNKNGHTSFTDFNEEDLAYFKATYLAKCKSADVKFNDQVLSQFFDLSFYYTYMSNINWNTSIINPYTEAYISDIEFNIKDATHINITNISYVLDPWKYPGEVRDSHPGKDIVAWKSRGIKIHIEPGTRFGMYLRSWVEADGEDLKPSSDNVDIVRLKLDENGMPIPDKHRRYYSEAKYNPTIGEPASNVFGSTYMYDAPTGTYRVLGFEDWGYQTHDLNDMMFFIGSADPSKIPDVNDEDEEWFEWILAAEDLGNVLCDWDFNDMVVKISTLVYKEDSEKPAMTKVKVEPLASGGTLPVYLMYTGKIGNDTEAKTYVIGEEFHRWFGSSSLNPINVSKGSKARPVAADKIITLEVPTPYTVARIHENYTSNDGTNNMGGFWFIANRSDGQTKFAPTDTWPYKEATNLPENGTVNYITAPDKTSLAPQMICVEGTWWWPHESKFISEAYTEFETWVKDATNNTWYHDAEGNRKHTDGSVIER